MSLQCRHVCSSHLFPTPQDDFAWSRGYPPQRGQAHGSLQRERSIWWMCFVPQSPCLIPDWEMPASHFASHTILLLWNFLAESTAWWKTWYPCLYLGIHQLRAFLRVQKRMQRSCCIIFLDLKEAFYRVMRPLAMHNRWDDQDIAAIVQRLGLPSTVLDELYQHLSDPCALQQADLPEFLRNCITALHTDMWFVVDGQVQDVCRTTAGSRPGDCFADTIFGYLWARVLRRLEQRCVELGLLEAFPQLDVQSPFQCEAPASEIDNRRPFLGPCWMDDLAIPVAGHSAEEAVRKVGVLAGMLLDFCVNFAMTPNLASGKTELLLALRGRGSRSLRQKKYGAHGRRLFPVVGEHSSYQIQIVTRYKHLGGIVHHGGDRRQEARQRLAVAHQTFTQQRKILFCNPALSQPIRTQMFESIVCSALTYGSESWCFSTAADRHHIHVGIIKLYKRLCKWSPTHTDGFSDDEICDNLGLPTPTEVLRRARLRYLGTLVQCEKHAEWGLLMQDQEWTCLLQDDLVWMWRQLCHSSDLCDPTTAFDQWIYLIRHHRGYWKRLINRAVRHAILQRKNRLCIEKLYNRSFATLSKNGRFAQEEPSYVKLPIDQGIFGCMACQLKCRSKGGEGAHFFKCHGRCAPVRRLFAGTWCPCCLKEFHTLTKMQLHLRNVGRCRRDLWARGHLFDLQPGIGSIDARKEDRHHDGALPPQPTQGAFREPVQPRELRAESTDLILQLVDALADRERHVSLEQTLRCIILVTPISWTQCHETLRVFQESIVEHLQNPHQMWILQMLYNWTQLNCDRLWTTCRELRRGNFWLRSLIAKLVLTMGKLTMNHGVYPCSAKKSLGAQRYLPLALWGEIALSSTRLQAADAWETSSGMWTRCAGILMDSCCTLCPSTLSLTRSLEIYAIRKCKLSGTMVFNKAGYMASLAGLLAPPGRKPGEPA